MGNGWPSLDAAIADAVGASIFEAPEKVVSLRDEVAV
jgi:hypothetical protein